MWDWVRRIPHPGYKKCGGRVRDCSSTPITDWLDLAFQEHDKDMDDEKLAKSLRSGDKKKLGLWGRIYLFWAKMVFKV